MIIFLSCGIPENRYLFPIQLKCRSLAYRRMFSILLQSSVNDYRHLYFISDAYSMGASGDSSLTLDALKALGLLISGTSGRYVIL